MTPAPNQSLHLTGAATLVSRDLKLQRPRQVVVSRTVAKPSGPRFHISRVSPEKVLDTDPKT
jgi:hypothetical protein